MDLGVLITAGIGTVTTFCSAFFTFIFSKKKYNAEEKENKWLNYWKENNIYEVRIY